MSAVADWAEQLRAWAIPDELLEAVDESPYGWPQSLWARRSALARQETTESVTTRVVNAALLPDGVLLDIGAGRGRASLPVRPHRLVAVEKSASMADGLRQEAADAGIDVEIIEEPWPDASSRVGTVAVAMCAHVVYDVQDLAPFLRAMTEVADRRVVVELTDRHPWASLAPYYRALHHLDRPDGPTAEDFVAVVEEVVGVSPRVELWSRPGQLWFESWDELIDFQSRRLVLPPARRSELRILLEPDVSEDQGRFYLGATDRPLVTVWWDT